MNEIKRPHYNSRFLTQPWEVKDRFLRYFDFETRAVCVRSSKSLFAKPGMNSSASDRLMSKAFEKPVAEYRRRSPIPGRLGQIKDHDEYRALLALFVMQIARTGGALVKEYSGMTVDQLLARGEVVFDEAFGVLNPRDEVIGLNLPERERLFFVGTGFFVVPLFGHRPVLAIPMTTTSCLIMKPRGTSNAAITHWFGTHLAFTAFSVGLGKHATRVVLPPDLVTPNDEIPGLLQGLRGVARSAMNLTGVVNQAHGLPGWMVDAE